MALPKASTPKEPLVPCLDVTRTSWKQVSAPLLVRRGNSLRALTLIEILVVLALFLVLGSFALLVSMETYHGSSFRSDRDLLVALLQHARAQSINNICVGSCSASGNPDGAPHGVHIDGAVHAYTVFQGTTYAGRDQTQDQIFSQDPTVTATIVPVGETDFIFTQLTGATSSPAVITLSGSGKTSDIHVETSGRIWWTN